MAIEEKKYKTGFVIAAAGFGAALCVVTGIVMGVLFAPKSGKETRARLDEWLKEKRDQGSDLLAKIKEESLRRKEQLAATIKAGRQAYVETSKHG
ncbi:MAG: YtxH domain-containing protein [Elusimicrobia bacterium]|nr:YtxH domain-containing protein [Elusimicrobiota bacterium]